MNLGFDETPLHGREFQFISANSRAFESAAAFQSDQFNLNGATDAERIDGVRASADFSRCLEYNRREDELFSRNKTIPEANTKWLSCCPSGFVRSRIWVDQAVATGPFPPAY